MALSFLTSAGHYTFVDHLTLAITSADALLPNRTYDVFVVVQNDDGFEHPNVQVEVSHSAFGIGLPGGPSNLIQPAPATVPPKLGGANGTATVEFQFLTPAGGHGCLLAKIVGTNQTVPQNVDVIGVPAGTSSTLSFLVYGDPQHAESMLLTFTEFAQGGGLVTPAQSWNPRIAAPGGIGPADPTPSPVTLNLAANAFYSVGLQVTVPAGAVGAHVFHIDGTVNGLNVGEVQITVQARPIAVPRPAPYVSGGYHTPDIILTDPLTNLPTAPSMDHDLRPNTNYGFQARIHNQSPTPAVNTVVRFWYFPGGCAAAGVLIDVQTASVPGYGSTIVTASKPFLSAPAGKHRCAVVSIYNALSDCTIDAVTAEMVPDAKFDGSESCAAWRNTDSMLAFPHTPWEFALEVAFPKPIPNPGPVKVRVETLAVPRDFAKLPELTIVRDSLRAAGAPVQKLYLLDSLQPLLAQADLGVAIHPGQHDTKTIDAERTAAGATAVAAPAIATLHVTDKPAPFTVTGGLPANAKPGDVFLVRVTAKYPSVDGARPRIIGFTNELTVAEKA
jgi:hypothetical protein